MAHTNVQLVSGNLTTGGDDPTFFIDRVNNKVGIGDVPDTSGDDSSNVLQITGSMLATKYHGDGSSLTGLNDSKWLEYSGDASKIYYDGGNVGIGLTDPGTALDVNGTVTATSFSGGELTVTGTNTSHNTTIYPLKVETVSSSSTQVEEGIGTGIEFRVERRDTDNIQGHCGAIRVYGAGGIPGTNDLWNMAFHVRDNDTQREPMTIKYNGNVGIGVTSPDKKLDVNGTSIFRNVVNIQPPSSGGGQNLFTGYRTGDSYGRAQLVLSSGYSDIIIASSQANDNHGSNLSFAAYNPSNAGDYRKFVINQGNWGSRKHMLDFGYVDSSVPNPHTAINSTNTVLTLDGINKRVGIGTTNPGCALHVNDGTGNINIGSGSRRWFRYDATKVTIDGSSLTVLGSSNGTWGYASIYANWHIVSGGYIASVSGVVGASDERIKKDIIDVDDGSALETLRLLKPKQYKYKDYLGRGSEPVWGFIAQEVRETLPYATIIKSDSIPNIYELATVSNSNVITFTNFDTSTLVSNASILKIFEVKEVEHMITINEVIDEHTIRVEEDLSEWIASIDETGNVVAGNQLFVYGQEVDDFIYLKKEAIFTVATAALQEVDRQLQAEKVRNDALEARILALESS